MLRVKTHKPVSKQDSGPHTFLRLYRRYSRHDVVQGPSDVLLLTIDNEDAYRKRYNPPKIVVRCDGLYCIRYRGKDTERLNSRAIHRYRMAHGAIFQSEYCRQFYAARTDLRDIPTRIILNGTDMRYYDSPRRPGVLCSAGWRAIKRPHLIPKVARAFPNIGFFILGDAKGIKPTPNMVMLGTKPLRECVDLYRDLTTFFHPGYLEGCSNSIVEAAAAGMTVICSSNGGNPDIVGDYGILYKDAEFDFGWLSKIPDPDIDSVINCIRRSFIQSRPPRRDDLSVMRMVIEYDDFLQEIVDA